MNQNSNPNPTPQSAIAAEFGLKLNADRLLMVDVTIEDGRTKSCDLYPSSLTEIQEFRKEAYLMFERMKTVEVSL